MALKKIFSYGFIFILLIGMTGCSSYSERLSLESPDR